MKLMIGWASTFPTIHRSARSPLEGITFKVLHINTLYQVKNFQVLSSTHQEQAPHSSQHQQKGATAAVGASSGPVKKSMGGRLLKPSQEALLKSAKVLPPVMKRKGQSKDPSQRAKLPTKAPAPSRVPPGAKKGALSSLSS